ncbi:MAG: hypothetical protein HZA01_15365 [Nitrospinae bacterium]|nr:hypothetical protein [Nitrospinota bacterium]
MILALFFWLGFARAGVSEAAAVKQVSAGSNYSLAVKTDGTVWAWGYNTRGQLGDGTGTTRYTPAQVSGLTGVAAVAAGYYNNLALKTESRNQITPIGISYPAAGRKEGL